MQRLYTSASKLALLIVVLTLSIGTILNPTMFLEPFKYAVTAIIGFYFGGSKGLPDDINVRQEL